MAISTARTAFSVLKHAYSTFSEYRDRKAREAYDALQEATETLKLDETAAKARSAFDGVVEKTTRAAEAATARGEEALKEAKKMSKRETKKLKKATAKAEKKQAKKDKKAHRGFFGRLFRKTFFLAILGAIAAAIYKFVESRKEEVGTEPPRIQPQEATLVYSTETPIDEVDADAQMQQELLEELERALLQEDLEDDLAAAQEKQDEEEEYKASENKDDKE